MLLKNVFFLLNIIIAPRNNITCKSFLVSKVILIEKRSGRSETGSDVCIENASGR